MTGRFISFECPTNFIALQLVNADDGTNLNSGLAATCLSVNRYLEDKNTLKFHVLTQSQPSELGHCACSN